MSGLYLSDENSITFFKNDSNNGYVSVELDSYPENPRDFYDGLGTFLTWQRRYRSPDANHYASPEDFVAELLGEEVESRCRTMGDVLNAFDEAGYAICGIYRFEHGQVKYELGEMNPFGDPWDSGPVGFAYVSPDKLREEGMSKENAIAYMKNEMAEYSAFANGDVYLVTEYDEHGEAVDWHTCYGLEGMQDEYPFVEEINLHPFGNIEDYAEYEILGGRLASEWAFQPATDEWPHDMYSQDGIAIVSDDKGESWRIVDLQSGNVSFAAHCSPQEALGQLCDFQNEEKERIHSFIPPKAVLEKALGSVMREAKSRAAEKNLGHLHTSKDRKPPEMGL